MCDFRGWVVGGDVGALNCCVSGLTSLRPPCGKEASSSLLGEMLGLSSKERDAWQALNLSHSSELQW